MKRRQITLLLSIVGTLVTVNMIHLLTQSIRLDEAQSLWVATKSIPTLLKMTAQDVQTPLHTLLLHIWLQIVGATITNARLLSIIFFGATLPVLYKLIKETTNRRAAILGVLLFVLSPFVLWYGQEARTYSLLIFVTALSHLFYLRFIRSQGNSSKWLLLITSIVGLYTHYFYVLVIISQFVYSLGLMARKSTPEEYQQSGKQIFLKFLGIEILVVLVFVPWLFYVFRLGLAANTQPLIPPPTSYSLMQIYVNFFLGFQAQGIQALIVSLWPLFLILLFIAFTRRVNIKVNSVDYLMLASILPVVLVYAASFYKPIFLPRYLILVVPTTFAIIAWLLLNLGKQLLSWISVTMIVLMLFSLNYQSQSLYSPIKEDYRNLVKHLTQQSTHQDIIMVSAPFTIYPIEYYYDGASRIDTAPKWDRFIQGPIPAFTDEAFQTQLKEYSEVYNRIFVVLSYNQGYQEKIVDYMDHNYQLLETSHFPADINLRVYQLRYDTQLTAGR